MNSKLITYLVPLFILLSFFNAYGQVHMQNEIVITATRTESAVKELAMSHTIITEEEIRQKGEMLVLDLLKTVPALDVVKSGGLGGNTSVFIRGANSEHTLVLIDGIESNDPISSGRSYNFAHLSTENIQRIEIIRGPQSTLYGSDAIAGVINIITKKGGGEKEYFFSSEAGTYNTFFNRAGLSGSHEKFNYSIGLSRINSDGISAANEKDGNTEEDKYENTSYSLRMGIDASDKVDFNIIGKYLDSEAHIDNGGGVGKDDLNNIIDNKQLFLKAISNISLFGDKWKQNISVSLADIDRTNNNDPDADHPDDLLRSSFEGKTIKFDWQNTVKVNNSNIVTFGFDIDQDKGESDYYSDGAWGPYSSVFEEKKAKTTGVYLQEQFKYNNSVFATVGVRYDDHEKFGSKTTFRIAPAYFFNSTNTKIKATFGTGFKAPTLYQLYSAYGDENLSAEKSSGFDAGIEQYFQNGKSRVDISYFYNDFTNLIDYDENIWKYNNIAEAKTKGLELAFNHRFTDELSFNAAYTYTDARDEVADEDLARRAKNKFNFNVNYSFMDRYSLSLNTIVIGERRDTNYNTYPYEKIVMDSYALVNLSGSAQINEYLGAFLKIHNLFDKEYEEVFGYGTHGFSFLAGLKIGKY